MNTARKTLSHAQVVTCSGEKKKKLTKANSILCIHILPSDIQSNTQLDCEDDRDSVYYPLN